MDGLTPDMIPALLKIGSVGLVLGWVLKFAEAWLREWKFTADKPQFPFSNFIPIANMIAGATLGAKWGVGEIWGLAAAGAGSAGVAELMKLIPGLSVQRAAEATARATRAAPLILLLPLLAAPAAAEEWRWDGGGKFSPIQASFGGPGGFEIEILDPTEAASWVSSLAPGLTYHNGEGDGGAFTVSVRPGDYVQFTLVGMKSNFHLGPGYRLSTRKGTELTLHDVPVTVLPTKKGPRTGLVIATGMASPISFE